jgi:flagellar protein FlaG
MIEPIQPNKQTTLMPVDTYHGQKLERSQEIPRPVVERKDELPTAREEIPREQVEQAADKLNRLMSLIDKRLHFELEEDSEPIWVRVVDQDTEEVLSRLRPKRIIDLLRSITDIAGLVVDEKV